MAKRGYKLLILFFFFFLKLLAFNELYFLLGFSLCYWFVHRCSKSFVVPSVVPRDSHDGKDNANSRRESVIPARPSTGTSLKPHHVRRPSLAAKFGVERLSVPVESESIRKTSGDKTTDPTFHERLVADDAREDSGKKHLNIDSVARKFEKKLSPLAPPSQENSARGNPVASKRVGSNTSSKVVHPSDSKEMDNLPTQKQGPVVGVHVKTIGHRRSKAFVVPSVVPRDSHDGKDNANSRRESVIPARPSTGTSLKPHHVRRPSLAAKFDVERLSVPVESESIRKTSGDKTTDPTFHERLVADDAREDSGKKHLNIDSVARKFEKKLSPLAPPSQENSAGGNPVASKRVGSNTSSKVVHPSDSKGMDNLPTQKQGPVVGVHAKTIGHIRSKSFVVPSVVPRDSHDGKDTANSRREAVIPARPSTGMSLKPHHVRRPSLAAKFDMERLSVPVESESIRKTSGDKATDPTFHERLVADDAREDSGEKHLNIDSVARKFEKKLSPLAPPSQENCNESLNGTEGTNSVKVVNGVAVVQGRTRSLVERFERRERLNSDEVQAPDTTPQIRLETAKISLMLNGHPQITERELTSANDGNVAEGLMQNSRLTKLQLIEPYGTGIVPTQNNRSEQKCDLQKSSLAKVGRQRRNASNFRCPSPDYETKEIKNIYVDTAGGNPVASKRVGSNTSSKVVHPSDSKEMDNLPTQKQGPVVGVYVKTIGHSRSKSFVVPSVVPQDSHDGKENANSRRESVIPARPSTGTSLKPHHVRRPSLAAKFDVERLSVPVESESIRKTSGDKTTDPTFHERRVADDAREDSGKKHLNIDSVARKFEKKLSPLAPPSQENCNVLVPLLQCNFLT